MVVVPKAEWTSSWVGDNLLSAERLIPLSPVRTFLHVRGAASPEGAVCVACNLPPSAQCRGIGGTFAGCSTDRGLAREPGAAISWAGFLCFNIPASVWDASRLPLAGTGLF
jgi:hypothetical protein